MRAGQKRAASIRSTAADAAGSRPADEGRTNLRLALSRGALALELDAPIEIGPLRITELAIALPGVQFPVDLTGGVARFRHRRGALRTLFIDLDLHAFESFVARRIEGILGDGRPTVTLGASDSHLLVGVVMGGAALAFDLVLAPLERDLRLLPENARALGFAAPPQLLASRIVLAATAGAGKLLGGAVVVAEAASAALRELMPSMGARTPTVAGVRWEAAQIEANRVALRASDGAPPPAMNNRALRGLELAELTAVADDLAFRGDLDGARRRYLELLERAPRHVEIARRIAWIDASLGDRSEAALSTLVEAMPAVDAGLLGGELLRSVGDDDGARVALVRTATVEPFGPLASLTWLRVAALATRHDDRARALDESVVRAPALAAPRWARFDERLRMADVRGAHADAEHLEAAAVGPDARREVWLQAARSMLARGFAAEARGLFERALRYAPSNLEAALGLGRALASAGDRRRSLDVLARAAALAARRGQPLHAVDLELGRGLAEVAGDTPAAIARVQAIPADAPESYEARLLEGRWRAQLGDLAGASAVLGRLRDAAELRAEVLPAELRAQIGTLLAEAADIEERERADLLAARRHLGAAMRLRPHDREVAARFRRVARAVDDRPEEVDDRPVEAAAPAALATGVSSPDSRGALEPSLDAAPPTEPPQGPIDGFEVGGDTSLDEARAVALTDRLRADPSNEATVLELVDVLTRLGRDLDLLALLSGRIDDGGPDLASRLVPLRRDVLRRLSIRARVEGRDDEADLYETMAKA